MDTQSVTATTLEVYQSVDSLCPFCPATGAFSTALNALRSGDRLSKLFLPKKLDRYLSKWVGDGTDAQSLQTAIDRQDHSIHKTGIIAGEKGTYWGNFALQGARALRNPTRHTARIALTGSCTLLHCVSIAVPLSEGGLQFSKITAAVELLPLLQGEQIWQVLSFVRSRLFLSGRLVPTSKTKRHIDRVNRLRSTR